MLKTLSVDAEQIDLATMTITIDRDARTGQVWHDPEAHPAEIEAEWQKKALPILRELGDLRLEDDYYVVPAEGEGDYEVEVQQFTF